MPRGLLFIACIALLGACTQRMVCPAYQSSFIYDKEAVRAKFSYFQDDSTPKIYTASKSKYLIAVPESYRKKYRKMQTVEMTPVYPVIPDSIKEQQEYMLAEADAPDSASTVVDTVYAITKTKERYNLDQDLYMWYFREMLVLPDVRAALEKKNEVKEEVKKEKKGIKGFFQNLFKKKPKNDSTGVAAPPVSLKEAPVEEPKKKKGLFGKKTEEKPPAKKEGDGF
jgi:hypothetical protein